MDALLDNPITSVQMQLRGGWKNLFITAGVYAAVVFLAMALWAEVDPKDIHGAAEGWTVVLMLVQTGVVLFFSIARISGSVRQDNLSGMIESHRLMPMTGLTACIGYIIGPASQMLAIGAVTFVAGIVSCNVAGLSPARWVMSNVIMFTFLLFAGACSVLVGFYRKALFAFTVIFAIVGFFSRGLLLYALPAVAILVSPLARETVFAPRSSNDLFSVGMAWAFIGQAIVGAVFLTAAARKFRQPDRPAFSVSLSLSLLAAFVVLNLVGMLQWPVFEPEFLHYTVGPTEDRLCAQFTGSMLTSLLLCLLPLSAAVRRSRENAHRSAVVRSRVMGSFPLATVLGCAVLLCMLTLVPGTTHNRESPTLHVAISMISALAGLAGLLTICRTSRSTAAPLVILFIFVTWFFPLFADMIEHSLMLSSFDAAQTPWSITAFGPIGTALSPWNPGTQTAAGLYCQIGIAAIMIGLALLLEHRRRTKPAAAERELSASAIPNLPATPLAAPELPQST